MLRSLILILIAVSCKNGNGDMATPQSGGSQKAAISSVRDVDISSETPDAASLQQMSVPQLQQLYIQRKEQVTNDQESLQLKQALSAAMCQKYKTTQDTCISLTPLVVSQYNATINCQGQSIVEATAAQTIQVNVPGAFAGKFILVSNDQTNMVPFQSTPFGSGTTTITFFQIAGRSIAPPTFGDLSTLYLASATPGQNLPAISTFNNFSVQVNGKTLLQTNLLPYPGTNYTGVRYNVPLDAVSQMRRSATCSMSQNDVTALTKQATDAVTGEQAIAREQAYLNGSTNTQTSSLPSDKASLITEILKFQDNLNTIDPALETTQDTLLKLTNALTQNQDVGCHYNDIIKSIKVEIGGSQPPEDLVGNESNRAINPRAAGGCNDFKIDFGSIAQTFDQGVISIFGSNLLTFPPNSANIGSLSFIRLKKARVCYDNKAQSHTSYIVIETTDYDIYEQNIFNVNSVAVTVNGTLIYQSNNLALSFRGPQNYGSGASFLEWSDSIQNNNPLWTAFMNKQDCNITQ